MRNKRVFYILQRAIFQIWLFEFGTLDANNPVISAQGYGKIQPRGLFVLSNTAHIICKCGGTGSRQVFSNKLGNFYYI